MRRLASSGVGGSNRLVDHGHLVPGVGQQLAGLLGDRATDLAHRARIRFQVRKAGRPLLVGMEHPVAECIQAPSLPRSAADADVAVRNPSARLTGLARRA
jgi:hypothetical protein